MFTGRIIDAIADALRPAGLAFTCGSSSVSPLSSDFRANDAAISRDGETICTAERILFTYSAVPPKITAMVITGLSLDAADLARIAQPQREGPLDVRIPISKLVVKRSEIKLPIGTAAIDELVLRADDERTASIEASGAVLGAPFTLAARVSTRGGLRIESASADWRGGTFAVAGTELSIPTLTLQAR